MSSLRLRPVPGLYAVCRGAPGVEAPPPPRSVSGLWSLSRTAEETSLVCLEAEAPEGWRIEAGWCCLMVVGPLDFSLVGVLSELTARLAAAGVPVFALSTFDTDYLLVRADDLESAADALRRAGHAVDGASSAR